MNEGQLWTKNFLAATLTNFFILLNFYLLMVITSAFAMESFNSTPSEGGLAASIFVIGALVARMLAGRWIERIGRKQTLYIGLVLGLVMTLMYFTINDVVSLFTIRLLHGVGFGISTTAASTIVASIVPKERSGEGLGYFMLSVTLATAIGPFLGIFISQRWGFDVIFMVCAIPAVLGLVSAFLLSAPKATFTKEQIGEMKGFKLANFFETKVIPISIVTLVSYFSYSSVLSFFTPYAKEIRLMDAASVFFIVIAAAIFISRPFTGRLFDSRGENLVMYPAFLVFIAGMAILSQAQSGYILLLAAALIGCGLGVIQSSTQAIAMKISPQHRLGLANSTYFTALDAGVGIGPFVLGFLIPFSGYRGLYLGMTVIAFGGLVLYYLVHGRRTATREAESSVYPVN